MVVRSIGRCAAVAVASACLLACATSQRQLPKAELPAPPPRVPPALVAHVRALRAEAKALLARQAELYWRNWVYGDVIDVAATYRGHERLFSPESIADVQRLRELTDDSEERQALSYLRLYLIGEAVGRAVAPLSDQASSLQADATFVTPAGVEQPYRELDHLLASEVSYALRGQISDAALTVVRKLNPILQEKQDLTRRVLVGLGYASCEKFAEELREADSEALEAMANQVLDGTEELYRSAMNAAARTELGIGLAGMRHADIPRFDRSPPLDAWFPAEKMLPTLRATLAGMGLDLAAQANVRIDEAPLPKKNRQTICFPIAVPGDVRLSVKPLGGVADYEALFHEAGHVEHYAHTREEPFELQLLGDGAVGEAYAFLFQGLVQNPRWLAEKVGLSGEQGAAFVRNTAVRKLFLVRRYAGRLLYELGLGSGAADPRALYRKTLSRAYAFPLSDADAERWLIDQDELLDSADYFRAWFLAEQLEVWLEKRFGPAWWDDKAAGAALAELWRPGNALGPDEIARKLGDVGVRSEPLLEKLRHQLGP